MKFILASASPRRKELFNKYKLDFEVLVSDVDEKIEDNLSPMENVMELAKQKCLNVLSKVGNQIVIAADTIVVFDDKIYGKPKDEKDAFNMLKTLNNKTHQVITAVAIGYNGNVCVDCEISYVTFKKITDEEINEYIKTKEPLDKAGSYAIQGIGSKFVSYYQGSYENIIGMPMELVLRMIAKTIK